MANQGTKISVIGAGSWGTALAIVLADNGYHVNLWTRKEEQENELNENHTNERYLPGIKLPENIYGSTSLEEVLDGVDTVILAVPTKAIREMMQKIVQYSNNAADIRSCE